MKESPRHGVEPLSSTEFAELEAFLARCGGSEPMSLEALDGFFCALVVGPETILPREYLPVLAGGSRTAAAHVFESVEEAARILGLLMRHWNTIAVAFERGTGYVPQLSATASHLVVGTAWADGFMRGVDLRAEAWQVLIDHPARRLRESILPMMFLAQDVAYGKDPDVKFIPPSVRQEMLSKMAVGLQDIQAYFREQRGKGVARESETTAGPLRRVAPKVGRNDPCPCGSGRKHKHCCGGSSGSSAH